MRIIATDDTCTGPSPCLKCPNHTSGIDKKHCIAVCEPLAAYQAGKPYNDLPYPEITVEKEEMVKMEETKEPEAKDRKPEAKDPDKCIVPGCNKPVKIRTMCQVDYDRWRQGTIDHPTLGKFKASNIRVTEKGTCLIDGCDVPAKVKGLCSPHYQAWHKGYIEHPLEGKFSVSQVHCKSKVKVPPKKPNPKISATESSTVKKNPLDATIKTKLYPRPDIVTLDFGKYQELKTVISEYADKFSLPPEHIIFSILAGAIAGEREKENYYGMVES